MSAGLGAMREGARIRGIIKGEVRGVHVDRLGDGFKEAHLLLSHTKQIFWCFIKKNVYKGGTLSPNLPQVRGTGEFNVHSAGQTSELMFIV